MIIARDKTDNGFIILYTNTDNLKDIFITEDGYHFIQNNDEVYELVINPSEFKQLFPTEKLPRKGSKQYISHLKLVKG